MQYTRTISLYKARLRDGQESDVSVPLKTVHFTSCSLISQLPYTLHNPRAFRSGGRRRLCHVRKYNISSGWKRHGSSRMQSDVGGFMSIRLDLPDWQWMEHVMLMCGDVWQVQSRRWGFRQGVTDIACSRCKKGFGTLFGKCGCISWFVRRVNITDLKKKWDKYNSASFWTEPIVALSRPLVIAPADLMQRVPWDDFGRFAMA